MPPCLESVILTYDILALHIGMNCLCSSFQLFLPVSLGVKRGIILYLKLFAAFAVVNQSRFMLYSRTEG